MKKSAIKIKALEKQVKLIDKIHCLKNAHTNKIAELTAKYNDKAVDKAEASIWDRTLQNNHKYDLLKDQSVHFVTKEQFDAAMAGMKVQLTWLTKIILMASGALAVIIWLLNRME